MSVSKIKRSNRVFRTLLCPAFLGTFLVSGTAWSINSEQVQSTVASSNVTGSSVSFSVGNPGTAAMEYSARGLPPGTSLDSNTGVVSGVLSQRGVYLVKLRETNRSSGAVEEQSFRWVVADQATGQVANEDGVVPGQYIVAYRETAQSALLASGLAVSQAMQSRVLNVEAAGGIIADEYSHALVGFSATLSDPLVSELRADPDVLYVTPVIEMKALDEQANATWGLDRVDQRNLPLNTTYVYNQSGSGIDAYIIDTGIYAGHTEFANRIVDGNDQINDGNGWNDCQGHGTHVAGTVGSPTWGVAKSVNLIAVRVLDCNGSGFNSGVIAGVDWAAQRTLSSGTLSVGNMSLGGGFDQASNDAVRRAVESGIVMAVAAGNSNNDACTISPGSEPAGLTVAATDNRDQRASFSSYGGCVDIHGPGVSVTSTWIGNPSATNTISGTSMATPHLAGIAALYRAANPGASAPDVMRGITAMATPNIVGDPQGSPNLLAFSLIEGGGDPNDPGDPGDPNDPGDPDRQIYFSDDFENSSGWSVNPNGSDSATTGIWAAGIPQQTASPEGYLMQPAGAADGIQGMLTDPNAGTSVGDRDVDTGVTSAISAPISLAQAASLRMTFDYFFAHLNNAASDDFFRVSIVDAGRTSMVFEQRGSATDRQAAWSSASVNLEAYAGKAIQIMMEASDSGTPSLRSERSERSERSSYDQCPVDKRVRE